MVQQIQPLKQLDQVEQAVYFHSRERRRSLAGIPELYRTHRLFGSGVMNLTFDGSAIFPSANLAPVTFKTAIRIADNATARSGLVFESSDATGGTAMWLTNTTIEVVSGDDSGNDNVSMTFDNVAQLPANLELDLVLSINPGTGSARLWANGNEIARGTSVSGDLGTFGWTVGNNGAFAQAANGAVPAGVTATAPTNFAVIEPLSVYVGQKPRQFV